MSRHKTAKSRRNRQRNKANNARKRRRSARPICPQCGSVDVICGDKTGTCNHCGEMFRGAEAHAYPQGTGEQSSSRDKPHTLSDEPAEDWPARLLHA